MSLISDISNTLLVQGEASSSANLGANGVFSSGWQSTNGSGRIVGGALSAQSGTLVVTQSADASHVLASTSVSVAAATSTSFSVEVVAPFYEVTYTNGATPQTSFHLSTFLRRI